MVPAVPAEVGAPLDAVTVWVWAEMLPDVSVLSESQFANVLLARTNVAGVVMLPVKYPLPFTAKLVKGDVVPTPTLPDCEMNRLEVAVRVVPAVL